MSVDELGRRDVAANFLFLFLSLAVAVVVGALLPIDGPSGPGTLRRGIGVGVFFTTYTLSFALYVSQKQTAEES